MTATDTGLRHVDHPRDLPTSGEWCLWDMGEGHPPVLARRHADRLIGIWAFIYTWGIVTSDVHDVTPMSMYEQRWCYSHLADAVAAATTWSGEGDPPGPWITNKPSGRPGPGSRSSRP